MRRVNRSLALYYAFRIFPTSTNIVKIRANERELWEHYAKLIHQVKVVIKVTIAKVEK